MTKTTERRSGEERRKQPFDIVEKPQHYNSHPAGIEAIDVCRFMTFDLGNAFKYIFRAPFKGTQVQDLKKALWYIKDATAHLQEQPLELDTVTTARMLLPFSPRLCTVLTIIVTASHHKERLEFAAAKLEEEIVALEAKADDESCLPPVY